MSPNSNRYLYPGAWVINVIKESKMDWISTPWVTVRLAQLLSWCTITGETQEEGAEGTDTSEEKEVDTVIKMKDSIHVGPFQTEILEGKISQAPTRDTHVMVAPIGCTAEVKQGRACQIPPGLQVLHAYTTLIAGSKQVSIVVRNVTDKAIFLKKDAWVAHIASVMLAPPEEAPSEQDEDMHKHLKEHMMVQERQEKLMEKLNLDGLSEWTPHNASIARELLLSYHDAFALEPDELRCTSTIEHEIRLSDNEPFKEHFRCIYLYLY